MEKKQDCQRGRVSFFIASWITHGKVSAAGAFTFPPGLISPRVISLSLLAIVSLILLTQPAQANKQGEYGVVPAPASGDILSVYSVHGPPPQSIWMNARMATRSDSVQSFQSMNFTLLYGLHQRVSLGFTATYFQQDLGIDNQGTPINKQGPGDARLFFKWAAANTNESPFMMGICPSLRIPTGYDLEGDGLSSFTTRTIDFECVALAAYETPNIGVYFNPGISLPGGRWNNELLGGFGFDLRRGLPLGLAARAEYTTRYDIVEESYNHAIFFSARRELMFGMNLELGIRRRLLKGTEPASDLCLSLFSGPGRNEMPSIQLPPRKTRTSILIPAVSSISPDPNGAGRSLQESIIGELSRMRGISPLLDGQGDYVAKVNLISIKEGNSRGFSVPKILATPKVTLEINALVTIEDGAGHPLVSNLPLQVSVKRGTGLKLLPSKGDEDTWLNSSQNRSALRSKGISKLAGKIAKEVTRVANRGESVRVITPEGGQ